MSALRPAFRTLTFALLRLALRPPALGRAGHARAARCPTTATASSSVPVCVRQPHPSPSPSPRLGGVGGCSVTVGRADPPRDLAVVGEAVVHQPGRRRREQPQPAGGRPRIAPSAGAAADGRPPRPRRTRSRCGRWASRTRGRRTAPPARPTAAPCPPPPARSKLAITPDWRAASRRSSRGRSRAAPARSKPIARRQPAEDLLVGQRLAERVDRLHLGRQRQVEVRRRRGRRTRGSWPPAARGRRRSPVSVANRSTTTVNRSSRSSARPQPGLLRVGGGDVDVPADQRAASARDPPAVRPGPCG